MRLLICFSWSTATMKATMKAVEDEVSGEDVWFFVGMVWR